MTIKTMFFKDVIGQEEAKQQLIEEVRRKNPSCTTDLRSRRYRKVPLAMAYARYICCPNRGEQMPAEFAPLV